jgi:hypothetical protein
MEERLEPQCAWCQKPVEGEGHVIAEYRWLRQDIPIGSLFCDKCYIKVLEAQVDGLGRHVRDLEAQVADLRKQLGKP